jgi:exosortase E/protease (VPEID-CTERM system)
MSTLARTMQPTPSARWVCLAGLLLAEVLVLGSRFSTAGLAGVDGWWAELLRQGRILPRLSVAVGVAVLLFASSRLREALREASEEDRCPRLWGPFLCGHLLSLAGFVWLTTVVLEGNVGLSRYPAAWVAAWALAGLTSLALLGAAALSPRLWLALAKHSWAALLVGVAVGVASWGAGRITEEWWQPLSRATLWVVHQLLALVSRETIYRPGELVVGTPSFLVLLHPRCSGYEGIGLVWVFLGAYLWLFRRRQRFPQALLLLPIGTAVIWLANAVRIAALIALGTWWSPTVAVGGFHSLAGWLAFNGVALGLVVAAQRSRFFSAAEAAPQTAPAANLTAAYLAPLFALLAVGMLTSALSDGFDRLYPVRVLAAAVVLWHFRSAYALRLTWSWSAVAIGVAVFVLWLALVPVPEGDSALPGALATLPAGWAAVWVVFRIVGSVVAVPLAEELAFRGYLTRRLIAQDFQEVPPGRFSWFSFLVSSVLFGLLHGHWLAGTLAGVGYALALYRRKELSDAVLAHMTSNALIAAWVLGMGRWSLWS